MKKNKIEKQREQDSNLTQSSIKIAKHGIRMFEASQAKECEMYALFLNKQFLCTYHKQFLKIVLQHIAFLLY